MASFFRLEDFIPSYPNLYSSFPSIIGERESPEEILLRKKEFQFESDSALMNHQLFIARFLSLETPYSSLLLFHKMGLGKTRTAIASIELARKQSSLSASNASFKWHSIDQLGRALIIVRGPSLQKQFVNELIQTHPELIPESYQEDLKLDPTRQLRLNRFISPYYQIETLETFYKEIKKWSPQELIKQYSNRYIIMDEVHHIRIMNTETSGLYATYHRFLHLVQHCKIMLMTGTPMKDRPDEIASVMNLILPMNQQLPTGKSFMSLCYPISLDKILNDSPESHTKQVMKLKQQAIPILERAFKGRISYLREPIQPKIHIDYQGKNRIFIQDKYPIRYFTLFTDEMSIFQTRVYQQAFQLDNLKQYNTNRGLNEHKSRIPSTNRKELKSGIYSHSRQASDFVFPDQSYGKQGFEKYMIRQTGAFNEILGRKDTFLLSPLFKQFLLGNGQSIRSILGQIGQCSSKWKTLFEIILATNREKIFVSIEFVYGSGAIVLSKLLELMGYGLSNGTEKSKRKRYILLTGSSTARQVSDLLYAYNHPRNKYGEYIQIVIGSRALSEGISLMDTTQCHILDPHWNFAETDQAIHRILRTRSFQGLLQDKDQINVKIYLHVSIPNINTSSSLSIDGFMYYLAEWKDLFIQPIESLIKRVAFDCAYHYQQNQRSSVYDGTRECGYEKCQYKCLNAPSYQEILKQPPIMDTYRLFYASDQLKEINQSIQQLFLESNQWFLPQMIQRLFRVQNTTNTFLLIDVLNQIIYSVQSIQNKIGQACFVKQDHNFYYLVPFVVQHSIASSGSNYHWYYSSMNEILEWIQAQTITQFCKGKLSLNEWKKWIPSNLEQIMVETAITYPFSNRANQIIQSYQSFIHEQSGEMNSKKKIILTLGSIPRCLQYQQVHRKRIGTWENCTSETRQEIKQENQEIIMNPYGYFGLIDKKGIFRIVDRRKMQELQSEHQTDKRKRIKGLNCDSWNKHQFIQMAIQAPITFPSNIISTNRNTDSEYPIDLSNHIIIRELGYNRQAVQSFTPELVQTIIYMLTHTKQEICTLLRKWFESKSLIQYIT